jgi:hypothetical protein
MLIELLIGCGDEKGECFGAGGQVKLGAEADTLIGVRK